MLLKNKKILLGVTGSIAAYKALELIRLFVKAGASVRVVASKKALRFVGVQSFEALTRAKILTDKTQSWAGELNHIDLVKWADVFVIAPATTNTIAKLASGVADNVLLACAAACDKTRVLAPAANTNMLNNPQSLANKKLLALSGYKIIEPLCGELACGVEGFGKLEDPQEIFFVVARELLKESFWENRPVVLSGGGTLEKIDDVRYISNASSGKMADSLAKAAYFLGADVFYAKTHQSLLPKGIHTYSVQSAAQMQEVLEQALREAKKGVLVAPDLLSAQNEKILVQKKPYFFSVAAVSDYTPEFPQKGKLKKATLGARWDLVLRQNPDILSELNKDGIFSVGFKAEFNAPRALENARAMLDAKSLDAVCLNVLGGAVQFGSEHTEIKLIEKTGERNLSGSKQDVTFEILKALAREP